MKYDGIVLSSMNDPYVDTTHLKIKPKKYITNDYLLKSGRVGGQYYLFTRGKLEDYQCSNATESEKDKVGGDEYKRVTEDMTTIDKSGGGKKYRKPV